MAKSLAQQTTGYINNGGLVELGANNTASSWDTITVSKPNSPWKILVEGDIPTDKTGINMSVSVFEGTIPLFSAVGTWQVQGQSSAGALKKNWKLKLKNPDTGNKLNIKIGDWFPMTSLEFKGYGTDRTLTRDCLTTELWRKMHSFETGYLAPLSSYDYFSSTDCGVHISALFSTAGFPVEIWNNGTFLGLYILRTTADINDYLMDDSNLNHILIQPQHAYDMWSNSFNSTEWDFPSPSVKGYDTGDDMSSLNADVNSSASRLITWMQNCYNNKTDLRSTIGNYLDLNSLLDYIIITELSGSMDALVNNWMCGSWNATATSGVWYLWPYDEDATWGLTSPINGSGADAKNIGWIMGNGSKSDHPPGFFNTASNVFRPELRARWKMFRQNEIITSENISKIIKNITNLIDPNSMVQDLENWSLTGATGSINVSQNIEKENVSYVQNYAKERIEWLDDQWAYYPT